MREELMIWFAQAVAHSLWEGVAIGLAAWVLVRLLRGRPASQHVVLCGALALMAICLPVNLAVHAPELEASLVTSEREAPRQEAVIAPVVSADALETPDLSIVVPESSSLEVETGSEEEAGTTAAGIDWKSTSPWVVGIYAVGLLAMLVRLVLACGGSRRLRRNARVVSEDRWMRSFQRVVRRLGVKVRPVLMWSSDVGAPVLVGVFKPMILLPVALANRLSVEQAEAVLAHELAHLRRHDHWILAVQRVVETVLFYHPVVWWMSRELGRTREQACDDMVLGSGSRPVDYAETLVLCSELRLAHAGLPEGSRMQLAATGNKGSSLRGRVMRVMGQDDPIRPGRAGWWLAGLFALALVAAGVGLIPEVKAQEPDADEAAVPVPVAPIDQDARQDGADGNALKHTVKRGETLFGIARQYNTSVENLKKLNPHLNLPNGLLVGQGILVAEPEAGPILVELILAEVADDYMVDRDSMRKEVLAKHGKIVSQPVLIVQSGRKGMVQTNRVAEVIDPNAPQVIDYSMEVTPVLHGDSVAYAMKVTRAQGAGQGTKLLLTAELKKKEALETWHPFAVGSMIGGAKLVGSVRFSKAVPGQVVDPPGVFFVLPGGKVRWEGKVYTLEMLKEALPQRGGEVVIKAPHDTPYREVIRVLDLLKPVFVKIRMVVAEADPEPPGLGTRPKGDARPAGDETRDGRRSELDLLKELNRLAARQDPRDPDLEALLKAYELAFRIQAAVPGALEFDAEPATGPAPGGRLAELEAQIAECELELGRLKLELAKLSKEPEEHDPQLRKTKNRLAMVQAYLKDLRAARSDLKKGDPVSVPRGGPAFDLMIEELELQELRGIGLGDKHPQVLMAEQRIKELKAKFPNQGPEVKKVQLHWALVELRQSETELAEIQASGFGSKHPRVVERQRRINSLRALIARLDGAAIGAPPSIDDELLPEPDPIAPGPKRAPVEDKTPANEPAPGEEAVPEASPGEGGDAAAVKARPDDLDAASTPEASEAWYNALPQRMGLDREEPKKIEGAEQFYQESYPLFVPGAPYSKGEMKSRKPYFRFGMNSRLQRNKEDHGEPPETLEMLSDVVQTVIFLERDLPGGDRETKVQRGFDPNSKADPRIKKIELERQKLELSLRELRRQGYGDKHPRVTQIRKEIEALNAEATASAGETGRPE